MNRISGALATLAALACAVLGLAVVTPSAAHAAVPPKPQVGQCHALGTRQLAAVSDTKRSVPCSAAHSVQTYAVVAPIASLVGATDDELSQIGSASCQPAWSRAVHGQRMVAARTVLSLYFFTPTAAQLAAGQSWVRCDVGTIRAGGRPATRTSKLKPMAIVRHSRTNANARCGTKRGANTPCSSTHAFRATKVFEMTAPAGAIYPGDTNFLQSASTRCPGRRWYTTYPSEASWDRGARQVTCWKKD